MHGAVFIQVAVGAWTSKPVLNSETEAKAATSGVIASQFYRHIFTAFAPY